MKNLLQISVDYHGHKAWFDFMELPNNINDLGWFQKAVQKDYPDREVRVVQVLEQ